MGLPVERPMQRKVDSDRQGLLSLADEGIRSNPSLHPKGKDCRRMRA
jgi:hypothetical protein